MDEVKEIPAKNKFISGLLGKKGDYNSIAEVVKKAKIYFDKPLRTLPAYDPEKEGPLVEFIVPDGLKEIERYWLQEPYTFVSILEDRRTTYYRLIEPSLTKFEKELLERIYEDFQDILILGSTNSKLEKDAFLVDRALFLLERYKADISKAALLKIMYYLRRNLLGYEKINPLLYDSYIEDISCDGVGVPLYHLSYKISQC